MKLWTNQNLQAASFTLGKSSKLCSSGESSHDLIIDAFWHNIISMTTGVACWQFPLWTILFLVYVKIILTKFWWISRISHIHIFQELQWTIVKDHYEHPLFFFQIKPALIKWQRIFSNFLWDFLTTEIFILSREHDFVLFNRRSNSIYMFLHEWYCDGK